MRKETAKVISQKELAESIFDLRVKTALAKEAKPGQFVNIYPKDKSKLLPRPISICEADPIEETLRLVYRVSGKKTGTEEFSAYEEGDDIDILGTLGNGFPVNEGKEKKCILFGGGIGIPPMLELSNHLHKEKAMSVTAVLGYRSKPLFLADDFRPYAELVVATEDGSYGTKGNVIDAVKENSLDADIIFACGPMPMLRGIKAYSEEKGIPAFISLEERMACGVGACLGCVCKTKDKDEHSQVNNARICTDGPVFNAADVEI